VIVSSFVGTVTGKTLKSIEVELTLNGGKLANLGEVARENDLKKETRIPNEKGTAMWLPRYDASVSVLLNLFE
jgi:hypothetical protein